jgi:hypothetical protein
MNLNDDVVYRCRRLRPFPQPVPSPRSPSWELSSIIRLSGGNVAAIESPFDILMPGAMGICMVTNDCLFVSVWTRHSTFDR